MKSYTVTAKCQHMHSKFLLQHDGEKWTEKSCDETTFFKYEDAKAFADAESETFTIRHTMVINLFETEEEQ